MCPLPEAEPNWTKHKCLEGLAQSVSCSTTTDLCSKLLHWYDLFAPHVSCPFGPLLVLKEASFAAGRDELPHCALHIQHIATTWPAHKVAWSDFIDISSPSHNFVEGLHWDTSTVWHLSSHNSLNRTGFVPLSNSHTTWVISKLQSPMFHVT